MVSGNIRLGELFSWDIMVQYDVEGGDLNIYYHLPDGKTILKIKLDDASKQILLTKRAQLIAFCDTVVTLSGVTIEKWEKQIVTEPGRTVEKWVKTS